MGEKRKMNFKQALQASAQTRMRSIQERISIASTFCGTVELEIRFGDLERAKDVLKKLHSTVEDLATHIDDRHVTDQRWRREFSNQLAQLRERLSELDAKIDRHPRRRGPTSKG